MTAARFTYWAVLLLGLLLLVALAATLYLPACPTEDSSWCYWDASTQGNTLGRSFMQLGQFTFYMFP